MKINITDLTYPAVGLLNQMAEDPVLWDNLPVGNPIVDVVLTVNGYEISYEKVIKRVVEYSDEEINKKVAEKLEKIMSGEGLKSIFDDLEQVRYQIREKIEKMIGAEIQWSED